ncbi:MAG TPA: hypothetical protein VD948_04735, partial [Rhodothermales bacterium]|nr:hypothetical protein [Rhodothermales bacterium]
EINSDVLSEYAEREQFLREASRKARQDHQLQQALQSARAVLLRPYQTEESYTQAFGRAILYVLRRDGPLTTPEIHKRVRVMLPDLCDDSEDRVIAGKHFGKLWKHRVRIAQSYLKRQGQLRLSGSLWSVI